MYAIQENSMPVTVTLTDTLLKKMESVAIPFVDTTHVGLIERAIDALAESKKGPVSASVAETATNNGVYPADNPPSLSFSKPTAISVEGTHLNKKELYWNLLLFRMITLAAAKLDQQQLKQTLIVNWQPDKYEEDGYRFIPEAKLSVQGADANRAWMATYRLAQAAGLAVDVTFRWANKEDAANPGQFGFMSYKP